MSGGALHLKSGGELAGALRILNLFAQRGLAPRSVALTLADGGYELAIDASEADPRMVAIVREKIAVMPLGVEFRAG